jgi:ribosomal protein S18 acetylase RimI-like enzyme
MPPMQVRATTAADAPWVERHTTAHWGAAFVVAHGEVLWPQALPGFVAEEAGAPLGLLAYRVDGPACEVVSLASDAPGRGVGSALLAAVKAAARSAGCTRVWLVTTNDNLHALGFYQRRGFRLVAVHRDALERSRRLKPTIPLVGNDGIPLRDELELEMRL